MKKQLSFIFATLTLCASYVYAHDTGVPHEEPATAVSVSNEVKLVPVSASGRRPVTAGDQGGDRRGGSGPERAIMTASTTGAQPMMPGAMGMVTTGDPVIDDQIKALNKEMEAKIKALREEYAVKIKLIVGDKKIIPRVSTTTRMRDDRREDRRPVMASTTMPGGEHMMDDNDGGHVLSVQEHAEGEVSSSSRESGNFIRNFFRSILGR